MTVEIEKSNSVWTIIHNRIEARNAVGRVQDALREATADEDTGAVTFSCGLAEVGFDNKTGFSIDEIIGEADRMLYEVKSNGKNGTRGIRLGR